MIDKTQPMSDDDLRALVDSEVRRARSHASVIAEEQHRNERFYHCVPSDELAPPIIDDRSSYVSSDVADAVEWMLPSLIDMFAGSDDAVEVSPRTAEDEQSAEQWTQYLNYLFYNKNPGTILLYTFIKDALIKKRGIARAVWQKDTVVRTERYIGKTSDDVAMMQQDDNIEIVEHTEYPDECPIALAQWQAVAQAAQQQGAEPPPSPTLHDLKVKVTKQKEGARVYCVPNEEFAVSPEAKLGELPSFIAQITRKTLSEFRAEGFDLPDDAANESSELDSFSSTYHNGKFGSPTFDYDSDNDIDPSMRTAEMVDAFLFVDKDGDGIAEYRHVIKAGEYTLVDEEVEDNDFICWSPIINPHEWTGMSIADLAVPYQLLNTDIMRSFLDNLKIQVNGRNGVLNGAGVNIDDLLTVRPGGIVRMDNENGVFPILHPDVTGPAISALQIMDERKEDHIGWTKYSQGTDANSLNKTATGINILSNKADMRLKLVGRLLGEVGVKEIFRKLMSVCSENAISADLYRLNGEYVAFDPREHVGEFDFIVNVGLGTNNKEQEIGILTNLFQQQMQALQFGGATPANIIKTLKRIAVKSGIVNPDDYYTDQDKQEGADPQQLQHAEEAIQVLKQNLQQCQQQLQEAEQSNEADQQKLALEKYKADLDSQTKIAIAKYETDKKFDSDMAKIFADAQASEQQEPSGQQDIEVGYQ